MQGVAAVAAMARRNAAAFRAIGNSFFPLLSSETITQVAAALQSSSMAASFILYGTNCGFLLSGGGRRFFVAS